MTEPLHEQMNGRCVDIGEIQKEEFVQNYHQYRWLDETRSKLIDRVFILTAALLLVRLQFSTALLKNPGWLFLLHGVFIVVSGTFAYSIVRYRRQQRGHGEYIKACRHPMLEKNEEFKKYKSYVQGKSVYLTLGVETAVVIIATFAPFVLTLDREALRSFITTEWLLCAVVFVLPIILVGLAIWLITVPYTKYNFKKEINWQCD